MTAVVEFCGERFEAREDAPLTIGREADVEIDDNPFLHRIFLQVVHEGGLWWLANVGSTLTATTGTSVSRSSRAPRICCAVSGQVSLQVEYMNVMTTTWPL